MLFPISYSKLVENEEKTETSYIDPESIVDIEAPIFNGEVLHTQCNIWVDNSSATPITVLLSIEEVAGWIDLCYNKLQKKCPFMYISSNLYVNAKYVDALEPIPDTSDVAVSISGSVISITLRNRTVEEVAKQINAVLESV